MLIGLKGIKSNRCIKFKTSTKLFIYKGEQVDVAIKMRV